MNRSEKLALLRELRDTATSLVLLMTSTREGTGDATVATYARMHQIAGMLAFATKKAEQEAAA